MVEISRRERIRILHVSSLYKNTPMIAHREVPERRQDVVARPIGLFPLPSPNRRFLILLLSPSGTFPLSYPILPRLDVHPFFLCQASHMTPQKPAPPLIRAISQILVHRAYRSQIDSLPDDVRSSDITRGMYDMFRRSGRVDRIVIVEMNIERLDIPIPLPAMRPTTFGSFRTISPRLPGFTDPYSLLSKHRKRSTFVLTRLVLLVGFATLRVVIPVVSIISTISMFASRGGSLCVVVWVRIEVVEIGGRCVIDCWFDVDEVST